MKKLLLCCLAALSLGAFAQETPDALVSRVTGEVVQIVRQDKEVQNGNTQRILALVDEKVLPHFDFQRMTAMVVGQPWRQATPAQRSKLTDAFKTLLVRTYANAFAGLTDRNLEVVVRAVQGKPGDRDVLVQTEIRRAGGQDPVRVDYRVAQVAGQWKVFDVVVLGVSQVVNYRSQFAPELAKGGVDGLIARLEARNRELEAAQQAKVTRK